MRIAEALVFQSRVERLMSSSAKAIERGELLTTTRSAEDATDLRGDKEEQVSNAREEEEDPLPPLQGCTTAVQVRLQYEKAFESHGLI
jgi:hypothetical protein